MAKRMAAVLFLVLLATDASCQSSCSSLPDAPSGQVANQKQDLSLFAGEMRLTSQWAEIEVVADPIRQFTFRSLNGAAQDEFDRFLGKLLVPASGNRRPEPQPLSNDSLMRRATWAASHILLIRDDSGKVRLNTSYFMRTLTSVAADTASRPYWRRSFTDPFGDFGSMVGSDAGMNLLHEFEPGVQQLMKSHAPRFVSRIEARISHN
jgi:hypothetical protein